MARKPRTELKDVFARPGQAPERNTAIEDLPRAAKIEETLEEKRDAAVEAKVAAPPEAEVAAVPAAAAESPPPDQPAPTGPAPVAPPVAVEPVQPAPVPLEAVPLEAVAAEAAAVPPAEPTPLAAEAHAPAAAEPVPMTAASVPPADSTPVAPQPVETAPVAAEPHAPAAVEPAPITAAPIPPDAAPPVASPLRRRATPQPSKPPVRPVTGPSAARSVTMLAGAALLVALAAPLLEDPLLGLVGITTPASRAQQEAVLVLARQEQKLRDLEQRLAAAAAQLAATRDDLQQSTQRRTDRTTWGAWGRLLSLGRVADALRGSTPFASDLAVARTVGAGIDEFTPDLDKLAAYASTGVPSRTDIDREFRRITKDTLPGGSGVLPTGLARRLDTLNPFTPGSSATPDPAPDLVQGAAARLAEGDLEEAVARIRQLGGTYQSAYAGWLEDAQARVNADALVRRIDRTLAQLARELPK